MSEPPNSELVPCFHCSEAEHSRQERWDPEEGRCVSKIIKRIEAHSPKKKHPHNSMKVDIAFTARRLLH